MNGIRLGVYGIGLKLLRINEMAQGSRRRAQGFRKKLRWKHQIMIKY